MKEMLKGNLLSGFLVRGYILLLLMVVIWWIVAVIRWSRQQEQGMRRGRSLEQRRLPSPDVAVSSGLLAVLMTLPGWSTLWQEPHGWSRNPALLFWVVAFTGMGAWGVAWGLRRWRRASRSRSGVRFTTVQARPGGMVVGHVRLARGGWRSGKVRVRLVLQRVHRWGQRNRHLLEDAVWTTTQEVAPLQRGQVLEIPFRFLLPPQLAAVTGKGRMEWVVSVEDEALGLHRFLVDDAPLTPVRGRKERRYEDPSVAVEVAREQAAVVTPAGALSQWLMALFVFLVSWGVWFGAHEERKPWLHLKEQLPPMLLKGGVTLCIFLSMVFGLLYWAGRGTAMGRMWRRPLQVTLAGDLLILIGVLIWVAYHGWPEWQWSPEGIWRLSQGILDGVIGMFLWVGIAILPATAYFLWKARRGATTGSGETKTSRR